MTTYRAWKRSFMPNEHRRLKFDDTTLVRMSCCEFRVLGRLSRTQHSCDPFRSRHWTGVDRLSWTWYIHFSLGDGLEMPSYSVDANPDVPEFHLKPTVKAPLTTVQLKSVAPTGPLGLLSRTKFKHEQVNWHPRSCRDVMALGI